MKTLTDIGLFYEKMVNKFSVNIIVVGHVKGCKEYKLVYDREKCEARLPLLTRL